MSIEKIGFDRSYTYRQQRVVEQEIEEGAATCESLDLILKGGSQLLSTLRIVNHDLALINNKKKLVFALDFSELYTYLWPEKSIFHSYQIIRELLHSKNVIFTLPPGTIVELVKHLNHLVHSNVVAKRKLVDFINNPVVASFLEHFERSQTNETLSILKPGMITVKRSLKKLAQFSALLNRLTYIDEMKNILPFESFFDEADLQLKADSEILYSCLRSLKLRRPGDLEINNFVDAYNYALIWALSNVHVHSKDTIYLMVTSSPIPYYVFRNIRWDRFPDNIIDPGLPELSLVRHPIHVLYLSTLRMHGKNAEKELRHIIQNLTNLLKSLRAIPSYDRYVKSKGTKRKESPMNVVRLPHNKQFLQSYINSRAAYKQLFLTVRASIESDLIAEENIRFTRKIDTYAAGTRISGEMEDINQIGSTRQIFNLFDNLEKTTIKILNKFKQSLECIPKDLVVLVDTEGIIFPHEQLIFQTNKNTEFECTEVSAIHKESKQLYLTGDIYSDYFAVWWPTRSTFMEFLDEVRRYIATSYEMIKNTTPKNENRSKEFLGIYIYSDDMTNPQVFRLEDFPELNGNELLEAASVRTIWMVRIAMEFGDFYYDFGSYRGLPQRGGFISHVPICESAVWLINNTNRTRVAQKETRRAIDQFLIHLNSERDKNGY